MRHFSHILRFKTNVAEEEIVEILSKIKEYYLDTNHLITLYKDNKIDFDTIIESNEVNQNNKDEIFSYIYYGLEKMLIFHTYYWKDMKLFGILNDCGFYSDDFFKSLGFGPDVSFNSDLINVNPFEDYKGLSSKIDSAIEKVTNLSKEYLANTYNDKSVFTSSANENYYKEYILFNDVYNILRLDLISDSYENISCNEFKKILFIMPSNDMHVIKSVAEVSKTLAESYQLSHYFDTMLERKRL